MSRRREFPQLQLGAVRRKDKHNTMKHTHVGLTDIVYLEMHMCPNTTHLFHTDKEHQHMNKIYGGCHGQYGATAQLETLLYQTGFTCKA